MSIPLDKVKFEKTGTIIQGPCKNCGNYLVEPVVSVGFVINKKTKQLVEVQREINNYLCPKCEIILPLGIKL